MENKKNSCNEEEFLVIKIKMLEKKVSWLQINLALFGISIAMLAWGLILK